MISVRKVLIVMSISWVVTGCKKSENLILSVIVPYFNRNAFIGETLDTLRNQDISSSEYEIIVVDDESDEEPVVLKDYVKRFLQIRYFRKSILVFPSQEILAFQLPKGIGCTSVTAIILFSLKCLGVFLRRQKSDNWR